MRHAVNGIQELDANEGLHGIQELDADEGLHAVYPFDFYGLTDETSDESTEKTEESNSDE